MRESSSASGTPRLVELPRAPPGGFVPAGGARRPRPVLLSAAARKDLRHRMLTCRPASVDRVAELTGASGASLRDYRHELAVGDLPDRLLDRGASLAFTQELPQAPLLYVAVRALRPNRVVETGVGPGYSTAWILAALEANGAGELYSLGPGSHVGRTAGVGPVSVGSFVPPALRRRWTLVLGHSEERFEELLQPEHATDLVFVDRGPDVERTRYELHHAWQALGARGLLLAHHVGGSPAWTDLCRAQGLPPQVLDAGPPALGALAVAQRSNGG